MRLGLGVEEGRGRRFLCLRRPYHSIIGARNGVWCDSTGRVIYEHGKREGIFSDGARALLMQYSKGCLTGVLFGR